MSSTTIEDPITNSDAWQLAAARSTLDALAATVQKVSTDNTLDAYRLGQLHQAITTAEESIFEVLNVAHSMLSSEMAGIWLHVKSPV